jgi:hypothetical protein
MIDMLLPLPLRLRAKKNSNSILQINNKTLFTRTITSLKKVNPIIDMQKSFINSSGESKHTMSISNWNITNYITNLGALSNLYADYTINVEAFKFEESVLKPHNITRINLVSPMFLHWFSGFVDGEGVFFIKYDKTSNKPKLNFTFKIALHIDDINILYLIQQELQIGTISYSEIKNTKIGTYMVNKFEDLLEVIIPIFKYAKLRTIKRLDFEDWASAIEIKKNSIQVRANAYSISPEDLDTILSIKNNMNKNRLVLTNPKNRSGECVKQGLNEKEFKKELDFNIYLDNNISNSIPQRVCNSEIPLINSYWLVGFIEGEGCFTIRKRSYLTSFSLTQSIVSISVLIAIDKFFKELTTACEALRRPMLPTGLVPKETKIDKLDVDNLHYFLDRQSKAYWQSFTPTEKKENNKIVIGLSYSRTLWFFDYLIPFLLTMKSIGLFNSRKYIDFKLWAVIIILQRTGLDKDKYGLFMCEILYSSINNKRYSTLNHKLKYNKKSLFHIFGEEKALNYIQIMLNLIFITKSKINIYEKENYRNQRLQLTRDLKKRLVKVLD